MFASRTKKQIAVSDEDVEGTVTIRKLSARSLEKAREAKQLSVVQLSTKFGPDIMKMYREAAKERGEVVPTDPNVIRYAQYERELVLTQGVESWTFPEKLEEGLADLDESTAELLFREIIDLSDPAKEEEEARGKGV